MKHWDLIPNEPVTLSRDGTRVRGRFLFRDTMRAYFMLVDEEGDDHFCQFRLRDDGELEHWHIEGADRNTRFTAAAS